MPNLTHLKKAIRAVSKVGKPFTLFVGAVKSCIVIGSNQEDLDEAEKECGKVKEKVKGKCKLVNDEVVFLTKSKPSSSQAKAVKVLAKKAQCPKVSKMEKMSDHEEEDESNEGTSEPSSPKEPANNWAAAKSPQRGSRMSVGSQRGAPGASQLSGSQQGQNAGWSAAKPQAGRAPRVTGKTPRVPAVQAAYQNRVKDLGPLLDAAQQARSSQDPKILENIGAVEKLQRHVQTLVDDGDFAKAIPVLDQIEHRLNTIAAAHSGDVVPSKKAGAAARGTGMIEKELGAHYKGEEKQLGWRHAPEPKPPVLTDDMPEEKKQKLMEIYQKRKEQYDNLPMPEYKEPADSDGTVTKHFNDAERDASALDIKDGKIHDKSGGVIEGAKNKKGKVKDALKQGYVVDPKTGATHLFQEGKAGQEMVFRDGGDIQSQQKFHSSVLAGGNVAGAGEIKIKKGKVQSIDNKSGHYKPETQFLLQTVEHLLKQGAMLEDKLVKPDGTPLKGPEKRLFQDLRSRCELLSKEIQATTERGQGQDVSAQEKKLADHLKVLRKLGWGESNRVRGKVADLTEAGAGKGGLEFKQAQAQEAGTQDFLATGGLSKNKAGELNAEVKTRALNAIKSLNDPRTSVEALEKQLAQFQSDDLESYPAADRANILRIVKQLTEAIAHKRKFAKTLEGNRAAQQEAKDRAKRIKSADVRDEDQLKQAGEDLLQGKKPGKKPKQPTFAPASADDEEPLYPAGNEEFNLEGGEVVEEQLEVQEEEQPLYPTSSGEDLNLEGGEEEELEEEELVPEKKPEEDSNYLQNLDLEGGQG